MKQQFFLIDAMAFAFRAYHAISGRLTDANNRPTNAVYGFARVLLKLLREHDPAYIAVIFDAPEPNFREALYPEYKATRVKTPPELIEQIPRMYHLVESLNLPLLVVPGVEADDVIGTLAREGADKGMEVVIVSGDKDMMQLITERVRMFDPGKGKDGLWWDAAAVQEKFGVPPEGVRDALALIGDSADNIPGVRQIGEVKARQLLERYHTLENLYDHLDEIKDKRREYLEQDREQAFFARQLIAIKTDVPLPATPEQCARKPWDNNKLAACLEGLAFHSLLAELDLPPSEVRQEEAPPEYVLIESREQLDALIRELRDAGVFAVDTETTSIEPMRAHLVGVSVCARAGRAYYIPIRTGSHDLESLMSDFPALGLSGVEALATLQPLLEDPGVRKIGHNIKYDVLVFRRAGIDLQGLVMDTMVASYLTDPSRLRHNLDELSLHYLNHVKIPITDLIGKGSKSVTFDHVPLDKAAEYACEDADMTLRLAALMEPLLRENQLESLFNDVEMPLVRVLANMEERGMAIDAGQFAALRNELASGLRKLESTIHELAGEPFNINSPKQLQIILFEKLGLKPVRKTKSGYSTDSDALEALADDHPLPKAILEYRSLEKLRSTYVDALPALVNPETGRIHTSFNQAVAATGRLSSSAPNLQNIPVRTDYGKRIRQGFVAGKAGWLLISADYSQIELRVLAHLSQDEALRRAFMRDEDIHRDTAARVFGLAPEDVGPDMRRQAKAVNFGVIYGISDFGLARNLGIAQSAARQFIEQYFAAYPGVTRWLETVKERARRDHFVTTLLNRRRYIADIDSSNQAKRGAAERIAVNTPVQGSAADIIKVAMVRLDDALKETEAHLLLQVHDELVVESPASCAREVAEMMKNVMEQAAELDVPLKVDVGIGTHWAEIH